MFKKVLSFVVAFVIMGALAVVAIAFTQPDEYRVERSITVAVSPQEVYQYIVDLKTWPQWSPWAARDPEMEMKFSEPSKGIGAYSSWKSKVEGSGKQVIVAAVEGASLLIKLTFIEPFTAEATADFYLDQTGDSGTKIVWGMNAANRTFMDKIFYTIMDFDSMIGRDYETGLKSLKTLAEK